MTLQQHIVEVTREAFAEFFRYAATVPADKVEWQPEGVGRSVIAQAREIAKTPDWAVSVMDSAPMSGSDFEAGNKEMETWASVAECEAASKPKLDRWAEVVLAFPEARLSETKWLSL
jgi:hypothetical protein